MIERWDWGVEENLHAKIFFLCHVGNNLTTWNKAKLKEMFWMELLKAAFVLI